MSVGVSASRVVALLDELVEHGFVSLRTHETDRRVRLADITDGGRA
jgi:DNA-binding MarR family transcriptional regulator